jgi:hypothetical protein
MVAPLFPSTHLSSLSLMSPHIPPLPFSSLSLYTIGRRRAAARVLLDPWTWSTMATSSPLSERRRAESIGTEGRWSPQTPLSPSPPSVCQRWYHCVAQVLLAIYWSRSRLGMIWDFGVL